MEQSFHDSVQFSLIAVFDVPAIFMGRDMVPAAEPAASLLD
jgi:hypothetical protein